MALCMQRRCTRFFAAIWLRHRSNSGFAGTETAEAPYASTGMITHDGNYSIKFRGNNKEAGRLKRPASLFVLWLYFILPV